MNTPNFPALWDNLVAAREDNAERERNLIVRISDDVERYLEQTESESIILLCEVFGMLRKNAHIDSYRTAMCCIADAIEELRFEEERDRELSAESDSDTDRLQDERRDRELGGQE
jgi:hypothetical protein